MPPRPMRRSRRNSPNILPVQSVSSLDTGTGFDEPAVISLVFASSMAFQATWHDLVGWVERSEAHRARSATRWASLRSTHPTLPRAIFDRARSLVILLLPQRFG